MKEQDQMESEKLTSQIVEKRKQLTDATAELEGLREQRARLSIDKPKSKALKELEDHIADSTTVVQNVPDEIQVLNERLQEAQAEEAQTAMNALLSQQKVFAGQMEMLSVKFVASLEIANDLNLQLITATDKYCALQKQTGQDVIIKPTCRGSLQMMKVLFETNEAELAGKQAVRTQGQPPFLYI